MRYPLRPEVYERLKKIADPEKSNLCLRWTKPSHVEMKINMSVSCLYCGSKTTRRKYCSNLCSAKARKDAEKQDNQNLEATQAAEAMRKNPDEWRLIQQIAPGMPLKRVEPIIWFLLAVRQSGYEIVRKEQNASD